MSREHPGQSPAGATGLSAVRVDDSDGAAIVTVHVSPGAKRAGVSGVHGDALKISVKEPPRDGRANRAVAELIAKASGVKRSHVSVVGGASARRKRVKVEGMTAAQLRASLEAEVMKSLGG